MSAIQKWVLYSTVTAIFCSRYSMQFGSLTLFYFYFLVVINLALLTSMGYLWTPNKLRYFVAYLAASGIFGLIVGTNVLSSFAKSFIGISLCAVYNASFLRFVRFNAVGAFRKYAQFAFYVAILGLMMLPFPISSGRVVSLFREPSGFAIVCIPAVVYYADQWQRNRRYGIRLLTLLFACVLTLSSTGFIGMMLGVFLLGLRYRVGRVLVPGVVALIFALAWTQSAQFQLRMSDTLIGLRGQHVDDLNESSFGVVASLLITRHQFAEHPFIGGGLGSHIVAHDRFFDTIPGAFFIPDNLRTLAQFDASSLLLRIVSELGIVGVIGALWFLFYYFPWVGTPEERAVSMALLCYIFMKFCRSGEYFGSEQYFFLSIYTIVGAKARLRTPVRQLRLAVSAAASRTDLLPSNPGAAPNAA